MDPKNILYSKVLDIEKNNKLARSIFGINNSYTLSFFYPSSIPSSTIVIIVVITNMCQP